MHILCRETHIQKNSRPQNHFKAAIGRLKFSWFSADWLNFDPSIGRRVVLKSIYQSISKTYLSFVFFFPGRLLPLAIVSVY